MFARCVRYGQFGAACRVPVAYHVLLQLLYIYILGWNVDFGHLEAVNLISANKYSEKQIGYLAMTLFLHEKHELLHLVVNSIRKDLLDHNELFNCLALHAIANVGGREMGEALSEEVHRLLISPCVALARNGAMDCANKCAGRPRHLSRRRRLSHCSDCTENTPTLFNRNGPSESFL